jgi:single-stranded-DNA-specific exonuclease
MMNERLETRWLQRDTDEAGARKALRKALRVSRLTAQVLVQRGIRTAEQGEAFLAARLTDMPDPFLMADMEAAVERLVRAVRNGERITVHGDYDVDGITATTLLVETLRACGATVDFHVPLRLRDGYGLSPRALEAAAAAGATLAITVDCGISAFDQALCARRLGLDLIITDHHQPSEKLPEAVAVLNPARGDCGFPCKCLAGVGVAFMLLVGLRQRLREQGFWQERPEPDLRYALDLVALGTIADIVPLRGLNRSLARVGLEVLDRSRRPGLQALKKIAGVKQVSCGAVGFRLAPRLNAAGRLEDARAGVNLLLEDAAAHAMQVAESLDRINRERQAIEQATLQQALERWEREKADGSHSIVLADERWHPGVIGIVASRMVEHYHRPTVLIALKDGAGKGSGRSIRGFHLFEALRACAEHLEGFGGHECAAGLSIASDRVSAFAQGFEGLARQWLRDEDLVPRHYYDAEASLDELDLAIVDELARLAPFGAGNPQPVFLARGVHLQQMQVVGGSHLRFSACQGGYSLPGIAFGMADLQPHLRGPLDILFTPQRNEWRNRVSVQLQLRQARPASI